MSGLIPRLRERGLIWFGIGIDDVLNDEHTPGCSHDLWVDTYGR